MRRIFIDKKGISNVLGYLFSFAVASLVMISAVLLTTSIIDDRTAKVGNMEAQSIANKIADGIVEAVAVGESTSDMDYNKVLDIPTDIAGRNYYVEVTDSAVYVNTTDGLISKSCPTYGAGSSKIGLSRGRFYGGSGKINITLNKPDVAYRFDFGTGNITSHSPVESGYYMVTNTSSTNSTRCDPPWWNGEYATRVPILVNNDSPENLIDVPIKMVLSSSSFDYSLANVTIDSSSEVTSNLMFIDPSRQISAKINIITSPWDPSWFYTYYDSPNPTYVEVKIMELSGGYNASYIDGATIKLKAKGEVLGVWDSDTSVAQFNAIKALEILENDGSHFLSSPTYTVTVYGLLKNGLEFSGSGTISIKGPIYYVSPGEVIGDAVAAAAPGSTIFIHNNLPPDPYYYEQMSIDKRINLIGESREGVRIMAAQNIIIAITVSASNVNIDSLTVQGFQDNDLIKVLDCSKINITNCQTSYGDLGIGIVSGSNIGISNCITNLNYGDGIDIDSSWNIRITNCDSYFNNNDEGDGFDIEDCHDIILSNCNSYANTGDNGNGILLEDSYGCVIKDSLIYSNNGAGGDGIHILTTADPGSYNNQIINCTIFNQDDSVHDNAGIYIEDGPNSVIPDPCNSIKNCKIFNNRFGIAFFALTFGDSCYNYIEGCSVYNNSDIGIMIITENIAGASHDNHIIDSNVYENGHDGIHLWGSSYNEIHGCNIFDNGRDGLCLEGGILAWSSDNTITNNNFYCNGKADSSGTGVYCGGEPSTGFVGSDSNHINNNNFGFDYPYNKNCIDYNAKYAIDDYNWQDVDKKNNWDNNFWDNYVSGSYYIPNSKMNNDYGNSDGHPDLRWLNPDYIIVTPKQQTTSITIKGIGDTADSYVSEEWQGENYGPSDSIWVDPYHHTWMLHKINRIFIKFDLSDIPPVQNIVSAKLYIYYRDYNHLGNIPLTRIHQCRRVDGTWSESLINWINQPSSTFTSFITLGSPGWKNWSVKSDLENFLSGAQINRGWVIKDSDEGYFNHDVDMYAAEYDSSEKTGSTQPYLEIVYNPASNDPGPYYHPRTIAKGIENVQPGGTVYVNKNFTINHPYNETLTIDKSLNLIGKNKYTTIINSNGADKDAITINSASYVNISGFTINNSRYGIKLNGASRVNITNCIIKKNTQGIYTTNNCNFVNITDCNISSNNQNGIYASRLKFSNITNCLLRDNNNGIYFETSSTKNYITSCNIHNNVNSGVYLKQSTSNHFINCNFYNNLVSGIYLSDSSGSNEFTNCDIYSNNQYGIYITSLAQGNEITNCNIHNNGDGIRINSAGFDNLIGECDIYSNNQYGVEITGTSYTYILTNKFKDNAAVGNAYDDGVNNYWDNGYGSGNLWDNYDEESEGAYDYHSGISTPPNGQVGDGSDGVADKPYGILGTDPTANWDKYPWCRKPAEMPYYIDYWNPYGESVILVNMSLANHTSKYIYLYYGYSGSLSKPKYKHNMSDVSIFSDDFNNPDITGNWWHYQGDVCTVSDGIITIPSGCALISEEKQIPKLGPPEEPPSYTQKINQSTYIVEARINVNNSEGELYLAPVVLNNIWRIIADGNSSDGKLKLYSPNLKNANIYDLNQWIRLKVIIYRSWGKYNTQTYINQSKYVNITGIVYNIDSYNDEGTVTDFENNSKIKGGSWTPNGAETYMGVDGFFIVLGCDNLDSDPPHNSIKVDWIKVMKAPVIPPTIVIGPVESVNYGWDNPGVIHSKNIVLPRQQPSDDPFYPGPVLRDFNYGSYTQPGTFNISNLPEDKDGYTITVTMGNATGACNKTTVEFFRNKIDYSKSYYYGKLIIPATEAGIFETKSLLITWHGGNLLAKFSSTIGNWTVNSMIIERGKKGIHVGLE